MKLLSSFLQLTVLLLGLALLGPLACAKKPMQGLPAPVTPLPERGQLPPQRLEQAARDHGGSFRSGGAPPVRTAPIPRSTGASAAAPRTRRIRLVIGPIMAEEVPPHVNPAAGDAGRAVRDAIREGIVHSTSLSLLEAPAEGHVEDTPRPDLADDGVHFVVKGTVRYQDAEQQVSVFLRAVDTATGAVTAAASGRAAGAVSAAEQATARLVRNLTERARGGSGIGGSR